ncbi:Receptor-like protein [Drosera capensis]
MPPLPLKTTPFPLLLFLFIVFLAAPAISDPNDESCLSSLRSSLTDPTNSLTNWTAPNFADPCDGFDSHLQGATCNNGRIYKLSLSGLSLRGTVSGGLGNCSNLQSLDLSGNEIGGSIPIELRYLVNLAVLNLSSNQLTGSIPPELSLCTYLNIIDLHNNQLTGTIPPELGLLSRLSAFDVSNNRLSGPIPTSLGNRSGNLPRFNASSFEGNKDLYGYPLDEGKGKGLSLVAIVGIGLGSGVLSLVVSCTVVCVWLRVTERRRAMEEEGKIGQLMPDY